MSIALEQRIRELEGRMQRLEELARAVSEKPKRKSNGSKRIKSDS